MSGPRRFLEDPKKILVGPQVLEPRPPAGMGTATLPPLINLPDDLLLMILKVSCGLQLQPHVENPGCSCKLTRVRFS